MPILDYRGGFTNKIRRRPPDAPASLAVWILWGSAAVVIMLLFLFVGLAAGSNSIEDGKIIPLKWLDNKFVPL